MSQYLAGNLSVYEYKSGFGRMTVFHMFLIDELWVLMGHKCHFISFEFYNLNFYRSEHLMYIDLIKKFF